MTEASSQNSASERPEAEGNPPNAAEPLLQVRDLSVSFPSTRSGGPTKVLRDLSFDVARGETLAVVGESSSGKSMTALSILGLVPPPGRIDGGQLLFRGTDLRTLAQRRMRRIRGNEIAMIFQEPMTSLNPVLTIGRQVAEPIRIHRGVTWREAYDRAAELLERVAIPDARSRLRSYPHEFSGGMRQRVMIAMALSCEPQLIIADEPTTALDVTVQAQILDLLQRLTRDSKTALILITHDLGVVARFADRVGVMYAGRIVESARASALYESPQHPYTQGLLQCIPRLDGDPNQRLIPIDGQPPDLAIDTPGCAFAERCPLVHERCRMERPCLEASPECGNEEHLFACFGAAR